MQNYKVQKAKSKQRQQGKNNNLIAFHEEISSFIKREALETRNFTSDLIRNNRNSGLNTLTGAITNKVKFIID